MGLGSAFTDLYNTLAGFIQTQFPSDNIRVTIDPVPNTKGCQDPHLAEIGVTANRIYPVEISSTGSGVTVAVLDTGVTNVPNNLNQPLFDARVKIVVGQNQNLLDLTDNPNDVFIPSSPDINDDGHMDDIGNTFNVGHGTGIALLAAGKDIGVAPGATVFPVRICNKDGDCEGTDVVKGVCSALSNNDPNKLVINMSFGSESLMNTIKEVITDATSAGTVVVAAAGNNGSNHCTGKQCSTVCSRDNKANFCSINSDFPVIMDDLTHLPNLHTNKPRYPAAYSPDIDGLIAVGVVFRSGSGLKPRWYSNHNDFVDLAAPDDFLLKHIPPFIDNHTLSNTPGISFYKGTSYSTGIVSGAAAVLKQAGGTGATPAKIDRCLRISATPISGLTLSETLAVGAGNLNVPMAIQCILNP